MSLLAGTIGVWVLIFLPGAWVTFGLPLGGIPFWARFLTGTMLAPLVVCAQFYVIRLLGVSFEHTATLLVGLNLPPLYLIAAQTDKLSLPDRRMIVGCLLVLVVPFAYLAPQIFATQVRLYTGHAWMHADVIYMIANGDLLLEDPELVGVRLGYPWAGHVYQAILSYLIGSPPIANYIWTNLLWLLFIYGFTVGIVAELGGNRLARMASIICLSFGVNFVGYVAQEVVPAAFTEAYPIWGDHRYTPWLLKFFYFNQMPCALGMFIAIVFLMIRQWPGGLTSYPLAVVCLLLCGLGIIYPLMFPPACAVVGAKAIAMLCDRTEARQAVPYKPILMLGIVLLIAGVATFAHAELINQDRVTEMMHSSLRSSHQLSMIRKAVESVIVILPFLAGLGLAFPICWKVRRSATMVLVLGGLASGILYVMLHIPHWRNEYKFIFTASICLAPFSALALALLMNRFGRWALPVFAVVTLMLAAPFAHKLFEYRHWIWRMPVDRPLVDIRHFDLRLEDTERFAGLCDAIRQRTPAHSILVLEDAALHFPTLTRRRLYVPPDQKRSHPGVNLKSDYVLINVRGYDKQILTDRRLTLKGLFDPDDGSQRAQSLGRMLEFNRPVAIVVDESRHTALLAWLAREGSAVPLYTGNGLSLWLVEPHHPSGLHRS